MGRGHGPPRWRQRRTAMDRDSNYVAVGAFVLLVIAMAVSFVFWYTDEQDKRTYQRYEIYFPGSVSGLTAGSPVRYLGVDVGKVARLMLDPKNRKRVEVIADVEENAPVDTRTLALLSLQGVTGLLFIDLEEDPKATGTGPLPMGEHYPVIRSAPSSWFVGRRSRPPQLIGGPIGTGFSEKRPPRPSGRRSRTCAGRATARR